MTDDRVLRRAYEELLSARAPTGRAGCPAPETLLALAERQGDEESRLATLDHVMTCIECRRELDLLRAALAAVSTTPMEQPTSRFSGRFGGRVPLRPLALAAGIVVVIGVGVMSRERTAPRTSVLRGGSTSVPLLTPVRRPDGGVLLRWRGVSDAPRYRVEVFTSTGTTVSESVVVDTSMEVSAMTLAGRPDTLRWTVTALRIDGGEVRSPMGRITP